MTEQPKGLPRRVDYTAADTESLEELGLIPPQPSIRPFQEPEYETPPVEADDEN